MKRLLCVAIHDVAPDTWAECETLLRLLDDADCPAMTLLVVPQYHHRTHVAQAPHVVRTIDRRLAAGAEVVLHGYYHLDESPPARRPREWLRRTFLTDREGEFEALFETEAGERIERGLREFARLGWPVEGFVPPAWLAGAGARAALERSALRYMTTHGAFTLLHGSGRIPAPCFTASTRAAWRRAGTRLTLAALRAATRNSPLLRIALHPQDTHYPNVMRWWRELLVALLTEREPMTKRAAIAAIAPLLQPRLHSTLEA